jgi:hypothetical protein
VKGIYGVIKQQVDFGDWVDLLKLRESQEEPPKVGDWVLVTKGVYKGDVGFVCATPVWGGVTLLLVPRITPPFSSKSKRKRDIQSSTTPTLFEPVAVNRVHNPEDVPNRRPVLTAPNVYKFQRCTYENGLVRRKYDLHSISKSLSTAPTASLFNIASSNHPAVSQAYIVRPSDWDFAEGERIRNKDTGVEGTVNAVFPTFVDMQLASGTDTTRVYWLSVQKVTKPGDYVEVVGGPDRGRRGFVSGIFDMTVEVYSTATDNQDAGLGPTQGGQVCFHRYNQP